MRKDRHRQRRWAERAWSCASSHRSCGAHSVSPRKRVLNFCEFMRSQFLTYLGLIRAYYDGGFGEVASWFDYAQNGCRVLPNTLLPMIRKYFPRNEVRTVWVRRQVDAIIGSNIKLIYSGWEQLLPASFHDGWRTWWSRWRKLSLPS